MNYLQSCHFQLSSNNYSYKNPKHGSLAFKTLKLLLSTAGGLLQCDLLSNILHNLHLPCSISRILILKNLTSLILAWAMLAELPGRDIGYYCLKNVIFEVKFWATMMVVTVARE